MIIKLILILFIIRDLFDVHSSYKLTMNIHVTTTFDYTRWFVTFHDYQIYIELYLNFRINLYMFRFKLFNQHIDSLKAS